MSESCLWFTPSKHPDRCIHLAHNTNTFLSRHRSKDRSGARQKQNAENQQKRNQKRSREIPGMIWRERRRAWWPDK
jgi:hypothetical protein